MATQKKLDRAALVELSKARVRAFDLAGCAGYVRSIPTGEFLRIKSAYPKDQHDARLLMACLCDEAGAPVLGPDDLGVAQSLIVGYADRITREVLAVNALSEEGFSAGPEKN